MIAVSATLANKLVTLRAWQAVFVLHVRHLGCMYKVFCFYYKVFCFYHKVFHYYYMSPWGPLGVPRGMRVEKAVRNLFGSASKCVAPILLATAAGKFLFNALFVSRSKTVPGHAMYSISSNNFAAALGTPRGPQGLIVW